MPSRPGTFTQSETRHIPRRGLSRVEAAQRLNITLDQFDVFCREGRIPRPRIIDEFKVWDGYELAIGKRQFPKSTLPQCIYVVSFDQYVKIGYSTEPYGRISTLQDGIPVALKVHLIRGGARKDEHNLHRRFREYRTRGEWFRLEGELKLWIERGCP